MIQLATIVFQQLEMPNEESNGWDRKPWRKWVVDEGGESR